jgi:hypothetical protein
VVSTLAGLAGNSGTADGTGSAARFNGPRGVAVDVSGNLYVADANNQTIRKITAGGVVTTLAGTAGSSGSEDGPGSTARFDKPYGVAVDSGGNVYVSDEYNHTIRKIAAGVVTTLAGEAGTNGKADGTGGAAHFNYPLGVAVDSSFNVYVADWANHEIRKISAAGVVTTLAGDAGYGRADGVGSAARFDRPYFVAVDGIGNVFVSDDGNDTIRRITADGVVTTVAGTAGSSGRADGVGSAVRFNSPQGIAVDGSGNVYVGDTSNHSIRKGVPAYAPQITASLPAASSILTNGSITLVVTATGTTAPTFQWQRNAVDIDGATGSSYPITSATSSNAGTYRVIVTNLGGTVTSSSTTLAVIERSLLNLLSRVTVPARGSVGSSFTIEGGAKNILIRAVGPSLSGVTGALADPRLSLLNAAFVSIATNDDWGTPQTIAGGPAPASASEISAAMASVTPAPGFSSGSKDAALYVNLAPGTYTAVLDGAGGAGGITQLEIVDAATGNWPRVALLTMRGFVSDTHHLIVGFNLTGPASREYLIRVLGPSLGYSAGVLVDPVIDLYSGSGSGSSLYRNDDWPSISGAEAAVSNAGGHPFTQASGYSRYDSTLLVTLAPGTYTAVIVPYSPGYQKGEALFEIFNLDAERPAGIAPAITYLVKDQAVMAGSTATLGVVALAKPAATFQWRKYTGDVPAIVPGATSPILTVNNVSTSNAGSYDIVISNTVNGVVNTITSPVRTLSLLPEFHSADTNRDHQISVGEVTRVIQLYNSRVGATRTGEYHGQQGTEDGFAPGPGALTTYHSADYNRDGRIDADELLRVIELFNSRSGTVRTGAYRVEAGTEDGFAPVSTEFNGPV